MLAFNGTTDFITCSLGAVPKTLAGWSWAALMRTGATVSNPRGLITVGDGTANEWEIEQSNTAKLTLWNGAVTAASITALTADTFYLLGISKASGSVTPRAHFYNFGSAAFTHEAMNVGLGDGTGAASPNVIIGSYRGSSSFHNGHLSLMAVWNRVLTDAEFELLPFALSYWLASQPKALWNLDQQAVAQKVNDLTAGGAKESARTGTTISAQSLPIFSYGHPPIYVERQPAAAGGGGAAGRDLTLLGVG